MCVLAQVCTCVSFKNKSSSPPKIKDEHKEQFVGERNVRTFISSLSIPFSVVIHTKMKGQPLVLLIVLSKGKQLNY